MGLIVKKTASVVHLMQSAVAHNDGPVQPSRFCRCMVDCFLPARHMY